MKGKLAGIAIVIGAWVLYSLCGLLSMLVPVGGVLIGLGALWWCLKRLGRS